MEIMELLQIQKEKGHWVIDARDAVKSGHHPRQAILSLVGEAPNGTLCDIHVPHRTAPLIAALQGLGFNVTANESSPGHWLLRVLKF